MSLNINVLPVELVIEILTRLPFNCLLICECVCKEWEELINDRYFMEGHMKHSRVIWHQYNVRVQVTDHQYNIREVIPVNVHGISDSRAFYSYVCGCDGLVLLRSCFSYKLCLWNPARHLVLELPEVHNECRKIILAYVPATKNYRIVSIYGGFDESGRLSCEFFTPGQSNAWSILAFPDVVNEVDPSVGRLVKTWIMATCVTVRCLYIFQANTDIHVVIVSLDIGTEHFTTTHLPKRVVNIWRGAWCVDLEGKMGLAKFAGDNLEVINYDDLKKHNWHGENYKRSYPLPFLAEFEYNKEKLVPLFADGEKIWFWLKYEKVFTYSIVTGECIDIEGTRYYAPGSTIYPYRPSMVKFDGMEPDTEYEWLRTDLMLE